MEQDYLNHCNKNTACSTGLSNNALENHRLAVPMGNAEGIFASPTGVIVIASRMNRAPAYFHKVSYLLRAHNLSWRLCQELAPVVRLHQEIWRCHWVQIVDWPQ